MSNDDRHDFEIVSTENARPSLGSDQLRTKLIQEITVSRGLPFQILCAAYTLQITTDQNPTDAQIAESLGIPVSNVVPQLQILNNLGFVWRYLSEPLKEYAVSMEGIGKSLMEEWYGIRLTPPPESNKEIDDNIKEFNQTHDLTRKQVLTQWFLNNTNWIGPQMILHSKQINEFFNRIFS